MTRATPGAKPLKEVRGEYKGNTDDIPRFYCTCGNNDLCEELLFEPNVDGLWCPKCRTDAFLLGITENERKDLQEGNYNVKKDSE
jgi:hypothetical protein